MTLLVVLAACGTGGAPGADDSAAPAAMVQAEGEGGVEGGAEGVAEAEAEAGTRAADAEAGTEGGAQQPSPAQPITPQSKAPQPSEPAPAVSAAAQADAAAILRRAAAAYEEVRTMRADFVMTREIPALRQTITSRGVLYQQSPDRFALRFTDPEGDVMVSDGEYFWYYTPSVNADQVMQWPAGRAQGGGSGVDLKAQFVGNPVERFEATLHGTESVGGRPTNVLTLVPRQRAEYRSLKVWLDARDSLARRFEITEHNGSMRRFDLANVAANVSIPADISRFTPPAGARIIKPG